MKNEKSGIYGIECAANGKLYIGSSYQVHTRWSQHRYVLRLGKSTSRYLQYSWTKHGEAAFRFFLIEECDRDALENREQHYIDTLKPALNSITDIKRRYGAEPRAKMAAAVRARAAKITHCPHGHLYDEANTYINAKGNRICRECNRLRVAGVYASETPEGREARRVRAAANALSDKSREARNLYAAAHKAEKSAYDKAHRAEMNARRKARRANLTTEQKARHQALKTASYHRNKDK
jgi:group I intron endonuclease